MSRCSVAALLALPTAITAQVKLEVTPHFASFYATNELQFVDNLNFERQEAGPGIGASLTWRFSNVWAVEGQATYIRSGIVARQEGFDSFGPSIEAHVVMLDGRVLFQPRRTNLFFSLGAGTVQRGGPAFDVPGLEDKSDVAGIVGVGIRTRVSPAWGFRLGVELHVYETDIDKDATYYEKRQQRDVLVTIGVPLALIGR